MSSTRLSRDAGLQKVSSVTRWVAAGAIVVAGVLSAVAAKAVPGRSKTTVQTGTPAGQSPDSPAVTDNGSSQDNSGLVPPTQPPTAAGGGSGSVTSGAS